MKKSENDSLRAQIAAIEDVEALKAQYDRAQNDLTAMQNWYDTTKGGNETLAKFVDKLEEVQPSAVAIEKFSSNNGEISIQGRSYGKPAVAQFIMELKKLPYIEDVKTEYINESINDYSADDAFQMTFKLKYDDPKKDDTDDAGNAEEPAAEMTETESSEPAQGESSEAYVEGGSDETDITEDNETPEEDNGDGALNASMEGGVE